MAVDLKKAKEEAVKEVEGERFALAKDTYKLKLEELNDAKRVVTSIEIEIKELDLELGDI